MPDRSVFTTVITPTNAQAADDWHRERFGSESPWVPTEILGYLWEAYDVTRGLVRDRGHAPTEEQARREATLAIERLWDADGHRLWMEQTRHRRDGSVTLEELIEEEAAAADLEVDRDLAEVRARIFDQEKG